VALQHKIFVESTSLRPLDALAPHPAPPGCTSWAQQPFPDYLHLLQCLAAAQPRICLHGLRQLLGLLLHEEYLLLQLLVNLTSAAAAGGEGAD